MRVLMLETPQALLEERARKGLDRWDEMWDGVLHMVPPPADRQQDLGSRLVEVLGPLARLVGLRFQYGTGVFRPGRDDDYRVPDQVLCSPDVKSQRGVEGAALAAFEIHSPGDEAYEKIAWYLDVGVREVVIIDRDTLAVEGFRSVDEQGVPVRAGDTTLRALEVAFERVDDDHLRLAWSDGRAEVALRSS